MAIDYIPRIDAEFDEWFNNFAFKLPAIATQVNLPANFVNSGCKQSLSLRKSSVYINDKELICIV